MRRRHILLAGVLAMVIGATATAGASAATVEQHFTGGIYGYYFLVDSSGYTLYSFSKDHKNRDKCQRIRGCLAAWPPLTVTEAPTAGEGLNPALLSTITLKKDGGVKQVTYNGHALYRNADDPGPAEVYYFGFNEFRGNWFGVTPQGTTFPAKKK